MSEYLVVVEFSFTPAGVAFYLAHVFTMSASVPNDTWALSCTVTADSPEEAMEKAEVVLWLLSDA